MKDYRKLFNFVRPYLGLLILACLLMGFSTIFNGIQLSMIVPLTDKVLTDKQIITPTKLPGLLADLVDKINATPPIRLLYILAVTILALFLLKGIFIFWQSYIMTGIGQKAIRDVKNLVYKKLQELPLSFYLKRRSGELISRITNDVGFINNAIAFGFTDLVYQLLQVILFSALIFLIHWKFALIAFVLLPFISLIILKVGKALHKLSRRSQEKMADINSLLYETITGVRIVKSFCMEDYELKRFVKQNQEFYRVNMKSIKRQLILGPVTEFMGVIAAVGIFIWAGREVINGTLSFGVFGLFLGSLLSLMKPFKKLSQVNVIIQQALASSQRIYEVLDMPCDIKEKEAPVELREIKEGIDFEGVWFSYDKRYILQDINLHIAKGEIIAIVGPSGVGKTTLVDLIPRFFDPQKGRILIDGKDIGDFSLKSLRNKIGIVTQDTILFNDTIWENMAYGRQDATMKRIKDAARLANASEFIEKMPSGYETLIGDRGLRLSGGERQRIAIARALLKDPPVLILDEATSQLDSASERLVQDALEHLLVGRTVFIIAHRLSTIRKATKIAVLDKGRIAELGSHSELLERGGLYKKLYQMQVLVED